jgi:rare lipoprotein A
MRQTQLALSDIFSKKVQVTIYGALLLGSGAISTSAVFAQNSIANVETFADNDDETGYKQPPRVYEVKTPNKAAQESDDPVRDALRSVFKETAPDRIKENASTKQAKAKSEPSPESDAKETKEIKEALAKPTSSKSAITTKQSAATATTKHKIAFSGVADYYADRFHGRKTASGQLHDKTKMTAAHLSLPFGTKVKVVSRHTGKSCIVTVNDRGPYTKNRIIDLSLAAAKELGLVTAGSRLVDCYLIEPE